MKKMMNWSLTWCQGGVGWVGEAEGGHESAGFDGQHELGGAEDEEFPPALLQEDDLIAPGQRREGRHALGPPHVHKEEPRRRLADRLRCEAPRTHGCRRSVRRLVCVLI